MGPVGLSAPPDLVESSRREKAAELSLHEADQARGTAIDGVLLAHVGEGFDAFLGDLAGGAHLPLFTLHRHLIELARAAPCKEGFRLHTLSSRGGA